MGFHNSKQEYRKHGEASPLFSLDLVPAKCLEILQIKKSYFNRYNQTSEVLLSKNLFKNLQFIRLLELEECNFSNLASDAFNSMVNLEAFGVEDAIRMSHIELKGLTKLKWLKLGSGNDENLPLFDQVNVDLEVLEINLVFRLNPKSKIFQNFNFPRLKAFFFKVGQETLEFDLSWIHAPQKLKNSNDITTSSLRYLSLNGIKSLEGSFLGFSNLKTLEFSKTCFKFQPNIFNGLFNLKSLNISYNSIKHKCLPTGVFNGLVSLERLVMKRCNIR